MPFPLIRAHLTIIKTPPITIIGFQDFNVLKLKQIF